MKRVILLTVLIIWFSTGFGQTSVRDSVSLKIAVKLRDSLNLTNVQLQKIVEVNRYLARQKQLVRSKYASSDSIQRLTQQIEWKRDSLYKAILLEKYELYKEKKRRIVNNN